MCAAVLAAAALASLSACSASPALTIGADAPPAVTETPSAAAPPAASGEQFTPVVVSALAAPIPVLGTDERIHLAYELQLTNGSPSKVKITSPASASESISSRRKSDTCSPPNAVPQLATAVPTPARWQAMTSV